jgi:hypothetical protein
VPHNASENSLSREIHRGPPLRRSQPLRWNAISKADTAMSRWVIAAGLKLIVVPVDSTWMRRSLARGSRARASHASRARAGRQRQSKWAGSTRRCTRTALVTAPFLFGTIPAFSALPCGYLLFPLGLLPPFERIQGASTRRGKPTVAAISNPCPVLAAGTTRGAQGFGLPRSDFARTPP